MRSTDGVGQADDVDFHDADFDDLDLSWLRSKPGTKWSSVGEDVLPAWVADMDFPIPPPVADALLARVAGGDLGYPDLDAASRLAEPFAARMAARYGWEPDPGHVHEFTDIIHGVQVVLHLASESGDPVALHVPSYPPFLDTLARMGRPLLPIPMERTADGWGFDPQRLADDLRRRGCRTLLLVDPHNPTGRVFTPDELADLADLAIAHDLLVIADQVHADLTYSPYRHVPFASLAPEVAERTVTLTAATKAFNLAGIRCAVGHLGPRRVREAFAAHPAHLFGVVGELGVEATLAAWRDGDGWLDKLLVHLEGNRRRLSDTLAAALPAVRWVPPQATYLAWLDLGRLGLQGDPAKLLAHLARVRLSPGPLFGPGGEGFARLNFATSGPLLDELLARMAGALGPRARR